MKNKIIKKFVVLLSLSFVLFGFNFAKAVDAPLPVNINLKVYSGDTVLFNKAITVTSCPESPAVDAPITVSGKCAVEQSGLSNTWTWKSAPSGWLDQLGGYTTTSDFSKSWGWFNNLVYGNVALNQHILSNGEELLLTYNSYPLRISAPKTSGMVGEAITFTAEEESTFDANYNMVWTKSAGTKITLGTQSCTTTADGTCSIILETSGGFSVIGSKALRVSSNNLSIEISAPPHHSSGGYINPQPIFLPKTFSLDKAFSFLVANQKPDGSYGSPLYTDWVSMALSLSSDQKAKDKMISYLKENDIDTSLVTDDERRAMALMSLGVNPSTDVKINHIKKILASFDGTQFGDKDLYNDDIFALIVLKNAGYTINDEMISKDIKYLISQQKPDGSWGSIDMTAAYIEAVKGFENVAGVSDSIAKSESYIISNQKTDGGFENPSSTAWVLQSLYSNEQILKAEKYLALKQGLDGGVGDPDANIDSRIWETAYAVPAILHKNWGEMLAKFPKPEVVLSTPVVSTVTNNKKEIISSYKNKKIENKKERLNLIQSSIVSTTQGETQKENNGFFHKVGSFIRNTRHSFSWLLDKLSL